MDEFRQVDVIRNSVQHVINFTNLAEGDVIVIKPGMKVPADIRVVNMSPDIIVDETVITGDPIPRKVDPDRSEPDRM